MPEIVLGILVALLIYERTGFAPGGIITAGYLALYAQHGEFLLGTLVAAFLTLAAARLLSRHMVLYGRRLFCVHLLLGLVLSQGAAHFFAAGSYGIEFVSIGYLLPGLMAKDMDRQGVMPTLGALVLAIGLIRIAVFAGRGWLW